MSKMSSHTILYAAGGLPSWLCTLPLFKTASKFVKNLFVIPKISSIFATHFLYRIQHKVKNNNKLCQQFSN